MNNQNSKMAYKDAICNVGILSTLKHLPDMLSLCDPLTAEKHCKVYVKSSSVWPLYLEELTESSNYGANNASMYSFYGYRLNKIILSMILL